MIKLEMNREGARRTLTMNRFLIQGLRSLHPSVFGTATPGHFLVSDTAGRIVGDRWIVLAAMVLSACSIQVFKEILL